MSATPIEETLAPEAPHFEFFQAVRLLLRHAPGRETVGGGGDPSREAVRFAVHPSLSFPPAEIRSIEPRGEEPPRLTVHFFGMTGPLGVLPTHFTEYVLERLLAGDQTLRDFFDLFHHRLLSLFYRAWEKYRFPVPYERGEDDHFTPHLMSLAGLGTPGLAGRQAVSDQALLYYTGLIGQQPRSSGALRQLIGDYFGVDVEVEQFAGAWRRLDRGSWSFLEDGTRPSEQLGIGVILGDEVWDPQSTVMLRIGPLPMEQYLDFLPEGSAYAPLLSMARFFCGDDVDVEVQLVLKREEAPPCALDVDGEMTPRLGWTSWIFSRTPDRDPDDAVLRLWAA